MTTDLTDLFSADEPKPEKPKKKMGRPTREEALAKAMALEEPLPHYSVFRQPVGVTYLAKVVGKQPRQIEFRSELPKSNVGKILRKELRDETPAT